LLLGQRRSGLAASATVPAVNNVADITCAFIVSSTFYGPGIGRREGARSGNDLVHCCDFGPFVKSHARVLAEVTSGAEDAGKRAFNQRRRGQPSQKQSGQEQSSQEQSSQEQSRWPGHANRACTN
jgi:hypothetical protein